MHRDGPPHAKPEVPKVGTSMSAGAFRAAGAGGGHDLDMCVNSERSDWVTMREWRQKCVPHGPSKVLES